MNLVTTTGSRVHYTEDISQPPFCVELVSASSAHDYTSLRHELRALCAASLIMQLELGRPVVKLMNISAPVATAVADEAGRDELDPLLNYLAGLCVDSAYFPTQVLTDAALQIPEALLTRLRTQIWEVSTALRFLSAVGYDSLPDLVRPSVHLTIDEKVLEHSLGREASAESLGERLAQISHVLSSQALRWGRHSESDRERLFNVLHSKSEPITSGTGSYVPLPFIRLPFTEVAEGGVLKRQAVITDVRDQPAGFSLSMTGSLDPQGPDYGDSVVTFTLAVVRDLLDAMSTLRKGADLGADLGV